MEYIWYITRMAVNKMESDITQTIDIKKLVTSEINSLFRNNQYGFDVFVLMKKSNDLQRFQLEDRKNGIKIKIQNLIVKSIQDKFLSEGIIFDDVSNSSDNNKDTIYHIPKNDSYDPFSIHNLVEQELDNKKRFSIKELGDAKGFLFCFTRGKQRLWAYQHLFPMAIMDKKKQGFFVCPYGEGDIFVEQDKPMISIGQKINLIILNNNDIITDDLDFLTRYFGFEDYIKLQAGKAIAFIAATNLVTDMSKVEEYLAKNKTTHTRKMMRIKDSKVFKCSKEDLYLKITTLSRWKGKFGLDPQNNKLVITTFVQVENLIDLFDERYTRSDVSNEEYDTRSKKWVAPVEAEND